MTIILDNISKSYSGSVALQNFRAEIEWGKCYAFVGPAGSGKSTVLNIFMGTVQPDSGQVSRMGDYKYPTLHSAYVPQDDSALNLKKDALWNIKKAHRWASKSKAIEDLSKFLTPERITLPVGQLTPVERRFVALVRASFVTADFIVLDQPFDGMDAGQRQAAIDFILDFRGSRPTLIADTDETGLAFARIFHLSQPGA